VACYLLEEKEVVMAKERLTVRKIKEIVRLKYEAKLSNRATPALAPQVQV